MTTSLEESRRWCKETTRRAATSFYYAFKTLPRHKREGFEIVYAFMRHSDDLSDDAIISAKDTAIKDWRSRLEQGLAGDADVHPVMPALLRTLDEFDIDPKHLFDLIDGTAQDLHISRMATEEELYDYCYLVASTVGLVSMRLFGLADPSPENWQRADELAILNGQAFQLTNILRDVAEDAERDRIYLPQTLLAKFEVNEDELASPTVDERIQEMMAHEVARAEAYYVQSRPLLDMVAKDARAGLVTMRGIYHGILDRIVAQNYDVWSRRARVPLPSKLSIAARAYFGLGAET